MTAVGTNAGASATKTAATGKRYLVTGVEVSGDAACVVTVESPSGTALVKERFAAAFTKEFSWDVGELDAGAANQAVLAKISASTSNCEVTIHGVSVRDLSA